MPVPVINNDTAIDHQVLTVNVNFSIDIPISNSPTQVSVDGSLEGYVYSYDNGNVNISGLPKDIGSDKEWTITATNDDGTDTATVQYSVFGITPVINLEGIGTQTIYYSAMYNLEIPISNQPSKVSIDGLLTGLKYDISSNGVIITGVADDEADFTVSQGVFTIVASNVIGLNDVEGTDTETLNYNLESGTVPVLSAISNQSVTYGENFSYTASATAIPQHTFSATGLPSGITINPTSGLISGSSTEIGNHDVTVTATNPVGSDSESFVLTVRGTVPVLNAIGTQTATYNVFFSYTASATAIPDATFSATGLPPGISIGQNSGTISGTSTSVGSYSVVVTATNSVGSDMESFTMNVDRAPIISDVPSTYTINQNQFFSDSFSVVGYPQPNVTGSNLPPGITVSGSGSSWTVSGSTSSAIDRTATISASNRAGSDSASVFCDIITVPNAPIVSATVSGTTVTVTWASGGDGGSPILEWGLDHFSPQNVQDTAVAVTTTSASYTGSTAGTFGTYVRARNSIGWGPYGGTTYTVTAIAPFYNPNVVQFSLPRSTPVGSHAYNIGLRVGLTGSEPFTFTITDWSNGYLTFTRIGNLLNISVARSMATLNTGVTTIGAITATNIAGTSALQIRMNLT